MNAPSTTPIEPSALHQEAAVDVLDGRSTSGDVGLRDAIARAIAEAEARGRRLGPGSNAPPVELLPEKLIDPEVLPELFEANYGPLMKRGEELAAGIGRWKERHLVPRPADWPADKGWPERYAISDEATNSRTSNFLRLIATYAGGRSAASGEVDEARAKCKKPVLDAGKVIDAWFGSLRDGIRKDVAVMDRAQQDYLEGVRQREQERRDAEAATALEEANRLTEKARAAGGAEAIVQQAVQAEEKADAAIKAAEAPITELTRSRSSEGTTTSLVERWTWKLTDIGALVRAAAAGTVPTLFLTTNDSVIGAAVRPKGGLRQCPGLAIEPETRVGRTGRTS